MNTDDDERSEDRGIPLQAAIAWLVTGDSGLAKKLMRTRAHMPLKKVVQLHEAETGTRIPIRMNVEKAWNELVSRAVSVNGDIYGVRISPNDEGLVNLNDARKSAAELISPALFASLDLLDRDGMILRPQTKIFSDAASWWALIRVPSQYLDIAQSQSTRAGAQPRKNSHAKQARVEAFLRLKYGEEGPSKDDAPHEIVKAVAEYFKKREWASVDPQTIRRARKAIKDDQ
jgi:hypothetical protein